MCREYTFIFVSLILSNWLTAQMPNTNIYSLELKSNEQKVLVSNLTLLTNFNIEGYNNQPHFINDDELLITSNYESSGLTDILHLDLEKHQVTRITKTEESEYSPTVMSNGYDFSVIRQELDDTQPVPQVLWSYPMDRSSFGNALPLNFTNIGYHAWLSEDKVALYLVGSPSELILFDLQKNSSTHIGRNVGRCLKVDKKGNLLFTQNNESGTEIRSFDPYLGRSKKIANMIEGHQDFDILPNGHLITGQGSTLMTFQPFVSSDWQDLEDFSALGVGKITRISSSRSKIAIVVSK